MQHVYSVSGQFMEEVINAFKRMEFPHDISLDLNQYDSLDDRVPLITFCGLLDDMKNATGITEIGLLLGKHMEPACFTILGHLVMACNTIGEALSLVTKLQPLIIDVAHSECQQHANIVEFSWIPSSRLPKGEPILIDLILSATRHFGIWATGISDPFQETKFQYEAPKNTKLHREIFGPNISFGQPGNSFSIPCRWYNRTIRTANKTLKPIIYHHAELLLKEMQTPDDIVLRLSHALEHLLPEGHATIESAAALLYLSPRTLQRYLQERSTSFSEVLQKVRFEKAEALLKTTRLPLIEIAAQLGYREQSSFSYAYKNWSGVCPKQIRINANAAV